MTVSDLNPDLDHARQFLALLDSDPASFTFQVIPERTGSNAAPKFLHGSVDTLADQLVAANQAGAGIFFMVNAGTSAGGVPKTCSVCVPISLTSTRPASIRCSRPNCHRTSSWRAVREVARLLACGGRSVA
jgi:hypothetical protein